jgi:hypothetical protein
MAKAKTLDTSAGQQAYALASQHRQDLDPRLPAGMIDNLKTDLETLGVAFPAPSPSPGQPSPPAQPPPTLAEALAAAEGLVTAIHDAVLGAKPKPAVRKAYGAGSKAVGKEVKQVVAAGELIVERAETNPAEALSLGILPADVTALAAAVAALKAAEQAARPGGGKAEVTAKQKRAAEARVHEAVARIAGTGVLAFATNAAVRAEFEALRPKKKA